MNILYIITQADGGGAQKYVLTLAKHFKGDIAAGDEAQKLFDDAKAAGLTVYPLKHLKRNIHPWHDFWAIWEIRRLIKSIEPDIVHLNSTKAGILGSFASIGLRQGMPRTDRQGWSGARVVFTAHGFRFLEPLSYAAKNFYLALEKTASFYRDSIITVSDADKKAALENRLIDKSKIQTIYNGIEKIDFIPRENARRELDLPMDKKIYVTIANDYKTKGLDVFGTFKPISGTMIAVIGQVSNNRQSNESIRYLGYKPNASKYFKAFDGTIIPSRKEGFPFVALEAMQAEQPIIATNVGGIPEALQDAGVLIEPDDPKALRECIEAEFLDENRAKELSQKALERAKLFTEEKMLSETEKVYRNLFLR